MRKKQRKKAKKGLYKSLCTCLAVLSRLNMCTVQCTARPCETVMNDPAEFQVLL